MSGSTLGTLFRVTNFGESHGPAIGCVVDGCPPGMALSEADIQPELDRRRPGTSRHVTQRQEQDKVEILSGVFEGRTTGTPIGLLIRNTDQRSKDYANLLDTFRPGHADYTYLHKYGFRDPRGGGRASARLTAPTVAAAAIARKWLKLQHGTRFVAHLSQIGEIVIPFEGEEHIADNPFFAANASDIARIEAYVDQLRKDGDSCGARVDVVASGMPVGLGAPLYDKLDADIAYAMMGLNAVKGVEIGAGFASIAQRGTTHGDELTPEGFVGNNAGGVLGGISTGQDLTVSIAIKPTSSIRSPRRSIDLEGKATRGRDPRPARPLRRHPRRADRRGAARAGGDGPRAAASGAVRRRARLHPADLGPRALIPAIGRRSGSRHEHATSPAPLPHPLAADPRRGGLSRPAADGQADPALVLARPDDARRARDERVVRLDRRRHRRPRGRPAGGALQPGDEGRAPDRDRTVLRQPSGAAHRELSARTRLRGGARGLVAALSADADRGRTGSRGHAQRRRHRVRRPTSCWCRTSATSPSAARTRADTS